MNVREQKALVAKLVGKTIYDGYGTNWTIIGWRAGAKKFKVQTVQHSRTGNGGPLNITIDKVVRMAAGDGALDVGGYACDCGGTWLQKVGHRGGRSCHCKPMPSGFNRSICSTL